MVRARRWLLAFGVLCALCPATREARAQAEPIRVDYRAFTGCPDQQVFFAELRARTSRVRAAEPAEAARLVEVAIAPQANAVKGVLTISGPDGSGTRREVAGNDCAEVVSALALVAALVIDPRASIDAPKASSAGTEPAPSPPLAAPPAPAAPEPAKAASSPPGKALEPEPKSPAADQAYLPQVSAAERRDSEIFAGAAAFGMFGPAPDPAFGGGAFVGIGDRGASPFAGAARVALLAVSSSASFADGVSARFTWILLRPEGCPVRPLLLDSLRLELCASLDLGALVTEGSGLDRSDTSVRLWLAPGASVRFSWELAFRLTLEASATVAVPLRRYPFDYEPGGGESVEVHKVPFHAEMLALGLGYHFP